jgi:hypothetical protein
MYSLYKNEYRVFNHKKGTKVERRKIEKMNQTGLYYIYTWTCHKEIPYKTILCKNVISFFLSFAKLGNRKVEQLLFGGQGRLIQQEGERGGERV